MGEEPPEEGEMNEITLPSRHKIRNLSSGGLRQSRLLLGHGGSPQYSVITSERRRRFFFLNLEGQSGFRARDLRLSKQAALATASAPACLPLQYTPVYLLIVTTIWWLLHELEKCKVIQCFSICHGSEFKKVTTVHNHKHYYLVRKWRQNKQLPANTIHWPNVGSMGQRRRRWANIDPALG